MLKSIRSRQELEGRPWSRGVAAGQGNMHSCLADSPDSLSSGDQCRRRGTRTRCVPWGPWKQQHI